MSSTQDPRLTSSDAREYVNPLSKTATDFLRDNRYPDEPPAQRPRVYLAGPMRGIVNQNFGAFFAAEAILWMWGYDVVNPARMDIESGYAKWSWAERRLIMDDSFTIEDALDRDFTAILGSDGGGGCRAIFVLPGWQQSEGAAQETWMAISTGRNLFKFDPNNPINIHTDTDQAIPREEHPYENRCSQRETTERQEHCRKDAD